MVSILDHEIVNRLTFDTSSCPCGGAYQGQPLPQALRFSQGRGERGDHGKGTDGRRSAVSPVVSFPPSFACTCSWRERRLGARQYQGCLTAKFEGYDIHRNFPKIQYFLDLISVLGFVAFLIDIFPYCFATPKSTNNNNNNNNNNKTGRSFLVFRNGLNC